LAFLNKLKTIYPVGEICPTPAKPVGDK